MAISGSGFAIPSLNEKTQQHRNLYRVVDEKLNAGSDLCIGIKPKKAKKAAYQIVQPFHAENLRLNKRPHIINLSLIYRNVSIYKCYI